MRFVILLPLVFGAASIASAAPQAPAASQEPSAAQQPAAEPKAKPAEPRKICRREVVSGSNMKEKICLTAEQWKRFRDN